MRKLITFFLFSVLTTSASAMPFFAEEKNRANSVAKVAILPALKMTGKT